MPPASGSAGARARTDAEPLPVHVPVLRRGLAVRADRAVAPEAAVRGRRRHGPRRRDPDESSRRGWRGDFDTLPVPADQRHVVRLDLSLLAFAGRRPAYQNPATRGADEVLDRLRRRAATPTSGPPSADLRAALLRGLAGRLPRLAAKRRARSTHGSTSAIEPDPRRSSRTMWRWQPAATRAEPRDETHHVALRPAHRDGGGRCRSSSTVWSRSSRCARGTEESVSDGQPGGRRAGRRAIQLYFDNNLRVLRRSARAARHAARAVAAGAHPAESRARFPEFREITFFDAGGRVVATSRIGAVDADDPRIGRGRRRRRRSTSRRPRSTPTRSRRPRSPSRLMPATRSRAGSSARSRSRSCGGRSTASGRHEGYALLIGRAGQAARARQPERQGPDRERRAGARTTEQELADALRQTRRRRSSTDSTATTRGEKLLARRGRRPQPALDGHRRAADDEAFALADRARASAARRHRARAARHGGARLALGPVVHHAHLRADEASRRPSPRGAWTSASRSRGQDEIRQLGDAFNSMADRLVELQEDVRKQERQAMFGRIAAGLVHDLSHPIQNIGNSCKLIQKMFDDARVPRDVQADGRARAGDHQARARRPAQHRAADSARAVPGRHRTGRSPTSSSRCSSTPRPPGVTLRAELAPEARFIEGDVFALGRVYRNLIINAIQATAPGGLVVVATEAHGRRASRCASTTPAAAFRRIASARSSRTSSRPSGAGSGWAWRFPRRSSSSSAGRSRSRAKSARARRSCSSSRARRRGRWPCRRGIGSAGFG